MAEELSINDSGKPVMNEIATTAKDPDLFAGYLGGVVMNPDKVVRGQSHGQGLRLYDEILRDDQAGTVLQQRSLGVIGKDWKIIPGRSGKTDGKPAATPEDEAIAAQVSEILENCNFDQARAEVLNAILYGHYELEVIWQNEPERLGIKKLLGKHPKRFAFTPERELRLLTMQNAVDGEPVPARKFVVFTFGSSDNPYGEGLGQRLWWPVWFKKNGIKFWLTFLDKYGMPTGVGKYRPGAPEEEQIKLLQAIELIHSRTGVIIPEDMAISLLEAAHSGNASYEAMCSYMDKAISKVVLGQTLTTEVGERGSYAASQTHNEVRQELIEADADLLDGCLNETLIRWIVDYNWPNVESYPRIETDARQVPTRKEQLDIDKGLVEIGVPIPLSYFYTRYDVPVPAENEAVLAPKTPQVDFKGTKAPDIRTGAFVAKFGESDAKRDIDTYSGQLDDALAGDQDALIDKVKALVMSAASLEEIRDGLLELYPDMDVKRFGLIMQRALAAASTLGMMEVAGA